MYILSSKNMRLHKETCGCINMINKEHRKYYDGVEHARRECEGCISLCKRCFNTQERTKTYAIITKK